MKKQIKYVMQSDLISTRGWTRKLVKCFAGKPDDTWENPHYRSGPPIRVFRLTRIKRIEKGARFKTELEKSAKRKISALKAVETKRAQTEEWLRNLPSPELPVLTEAELTALALESFNRAGGFQRESQVASLNSDQEFLHRISVNYARHELTDYEYNLMISRGLVGQREARDAIREKILEAIETAYPWLSSACWKQGKYYFQKDMEELNCR